MKKLVFKPCVRMLLLDLFWCQLCWKIMSVTFWICSLLEGEKSFKTNKLRNSFQKVCKSCTLAFLICQDSYNVYFLTKFMLHITGLSMAILNVFSSLNGKAPFLIFLFCAGSSSAMLHWKFISSGEQTCLQLIARYYTKI